MARLSIALFGPFQATLKGEPVRFESDKVRALLAYLVTEAGTQQRREKLAGLLWPGSTESSARNNLRHTLAVLRQAVGDRETNQPVLDITRQTVQFCDGSDSWADVIAFATLLQAGETSTAEAIDRWEQATTIYQGDFLQDFSLPDSPEFEEWLLLSREQFRRQAMDTLHTLTTSLAARGEVERALQYARRQIELDPWREEAHALVMHLLARSGRRSEALAQYETCQRVLSSELDVEPSAETVELYEGIREGRLGAVAPAAPASIPRAEPPPFLDEKLVDPDRPLFVARERELEQLDAHLNRVLAGQGRVVFVTGEAGSGKTALIHEFSHRAQATHASLVVASGNCNAQTGMGDPYLPFREILELLTGDVEARWTAGAMSGDHARRLWDILPMAVQALVEAGPDLIDTFVPGAPLARRIGVCEAGAPGALGRLSGRVEPQARGLVAPSSEQIDFFEQYARVLQALAQHAPLVLIVDDLQWADVGSISLLFHLGRQLIDGRVLIVGAYRPVEVGLGRQGERHPLEPVVNEFSRLFGDINIDLGQAGNQEFVEALLDSEPNRLGSAYREMLYQLTRGHPLFTTELLHGMQERGDLVQDVAGRWMEGEALDWETLPARVEGAIAERVDRLDEPLQTTLRAASVEGETFTAEVVAQVLQISPRQLIQRLSNDLDRRHRLVRAQAMERIGARRLSRYRFRHILSQKYLYDGLDAVERTYLHEDIGNALEALYAKDAGGLVAIAPQLARHFQEAGTAEKAIRYLHLAGQRALRLSAYQEALAYLSRGLALFLDLPEAGDGDPGQHADHRQQRARQELELQLGLGMAWIGIKGCPAPEVKETFTRAQVLCQQLGRTSDLSLALGELAMYYFVRAEHQDAIELSEQALSLTKQAGDPLFEAVGQWFVGVIRFALGEYAAALEQLEQVCAFYITEEHHQLFLHIRSSDPGPSALAYQACCLWCLGYPDQAVALSEKAIALARKLNHPFTLSDVLCYAGCMMSEMRRDAQALRRDAEALIQVATESMLPWRVTGARYQGEALLMQGHVQEGLAIIDRTMATSRSSGHICFVTGTFCALAQSHASNGQPAEGLAVIDEALAYVQESDERHFEAEIHRLQAELLLLRGDETGAEASYRKALGVARRQEARSWELRAATGLARLWKRQSRIDEARELLAGVYGWFTEGFDTPDLQEARALLDESPDT